jgi:pyruvate dehydrogenase E1 component alpha subunit
VSVDSGSYRDPKEVAAALLNDPLIVARAKLAAAGVSATDIAAVDAAISTEIDAALAFAEASPWPVASEAYEDIMNTGAGVWL